jgi:hypothetical protein
MNRDSEVILNTILLFLVVIEPYLWTLTTTSSGATLYALDIGTALLILGAFTHFIIQKAQTQGENVRRLIFSRSVAYASALVFYASIVPGLIPELQPYGVQGLIWLSVLVFAVLSRFRSDKKK